MDLKKISNNKSIKELLEFSIINIDKPAGPTSFAISNFVKESLNLRKTSHFGTLDPKVTGVLPIALNRACRLTKYFIGKDKTYVGVMRIHDDMSFEKIQETINKKFIGIIKQIPPVKSRVKRQEREREVKKFDLIEQNKRDILFITQVQGGTYIRKLIHDLGKELNIGAHMLELRRIKAGIFSENDLNFPSIRLYEFEKAVEEYNNGNDSLLRKILIPGEIISKIYPLIYIKSESVGKILTGKPILKNDLENDNLHNNEIVCAFNSDSFIGIYKVINEGNIFAKPLFVFQPIK